jgi:hypothetical protein
VPKEADRPTKLARLRCHKERQGSCTSNTRRPPHDAYSSHKLYSSSDSQKHPCRAHDMTISAGSLVPSTFSATRNHTGCRSIANRRSLLTLRTERLWWSSDRHSVHVTLCRSVPFSFPMPTVLFTVCMTLPIATWTRPFSESQSSPPRNR